MSTMEQQGLEAYMERMAAAAEAQAADARRARVWAQPVWSMAETAVALDISYDRVRRLASERAIPYYKSRGQNIFSRDEIVAWMTSDRRPTKAELMGDAVVASMNRRAGKRARS